jgi:hypothetical protein
MKTLIRLPSGHASACNLRIRISSGGRGISEGSWKKISMIFPVFEVNGRRPFEQPVALAQVIITLLCNFSALLIIEKFDQFIGYLDANAFLRLFSRRTDMRRAEYLL